MKISIGHSFSSDNITFNLESGNLILNSHDCVTISIQYMKIQLCVNEHQVGDLLREDTGIPT
jgi:hypothetical protein